MTDDQPWYAVRCIFRHPLKTYEERITLWRATSFEDALERAETEAEAYAKENELEYTGYAQAFHLFAGAVEPGAEVYSMLRTSDLDPEEFVARFFDDGGGHEAKT